MNKSDLLKVLNNVTIENNNPKRNKHEKVLLIDGLNLFMRNFAMVNFINESGNHIGGLSGSLRSLGALIRIIQPTSVYVVFDGLGSSQNRKNLLPEYKSGRNVNRVTNWDAFENIEEEQDAKISQVIRLIHYLKCLPVKTLSIDKVEADDVIAHYSSFFKEKHNSTVVIVSNDNDFIQLVNDNVIVYRPSEKEFYDSSSVRNKFKLLSENFIIYKTLLGDNSDKISGIKGLGEKKLKKYFPELNLKYVSLEDIFNICEKRYKEHLIYARILFEKENIKRNYKIMDLKNPIIDDEEKNGLEQFAETNIPKLNKKDFMKLYKDDGLNNSIRNVDNWINEIFLELENIN